MNKNEIYTPSKARVLRPELQQQVRGGSWINTLVNLTVSGIIFWYHEGYKEGLVTRAKLKAHLSSK